jgi:hypothetical protein
MISQLFRILPWTRNAPPEGNPIFWLATRETRESAHGSRFPQQASLCRKPKPVLNGTGGENEMARDDSKHPGIPAWLTPLSPAVGGPAPKSPVAPSSEQATVEQVLADSATEQPAPDATEEGIQPEEPETSAAA